MSDEASPPTFSSPSSDEYSFCGECEASPDEHPICFDHAPCTQSEVWEPDQCAHCTQLTETCMGSVSSTVNPVYKKLRDILGAFLCSKPVRSGWTFRTRFYDDLKSHVAQLHCEATSSSYGAPANALSFFENNQLFEPLIPSIFMLCAEGIRDLRTNTTHAFVRHANGTHIAKKNSELGADDPNTTQLPSVILSHFTSLGAKDACRGSSRLLELHDPPAFLENLFSFAREQFSMPDGPIASRGGAFTWPEVGNFFFFDSRLPGRDGLASLAQVFHSGLIDLVGESLRLNLENPPRVGKAFVSNERKQRQLLYSAISTAICLEAFVTDNDESRAFIMETLRNHFWIIQQHTALWLRSKMELRREFLARRNNANLSACKLVLSDPFCPGLFPERAVQETLSAAIVANKTAGQFLGLHTTEAVRRRAQSQPKPLMALPADGNFATGSRYNAPQKRGRKRPRNASHQAVRGGRQRTRRGNNAQKKFRAPKDVSTA